MDHVSMIFLAKLGVIAVLYLFLPLTAFTCLFLPALQRVQEAVKNDAEIERLQNVGLRLGELASESTAQDASSRCGCPNPDQHAAGSSGQFIATPPVIRRRPVWR